MPLLDHFDILAPFYEIFIPPQISERLQEFLRLPAGGVLLDAGGGTGRVAQFLRGQADRIIVTDLSCRMLKEVRNKDGLLAVCSHTESLPFPDASFARIIMVDALHHVCDQRHTASELWRVLKAGGRIVIEEPDVRTPLVKLLAFAEKVALMRSHFLSPPQIAILYSYPDAQIHVESEKGNAWVIVEKQA
jgi:demethylmenaquinone methyltransferase/2-methoxy-6-polyprenyl-1,4-benzoquinol methylase